MPEGPEVKLFASKIEKHFKNSILVDIEITSGRYKKTKPKNYTPFIKSLKEHPALIESVNTKGKFIWLELDKGRSIWITLGLTGILELDEDKYTHLTFITNKGNFYMSDMINFGTVIFSLDPKELDKKLKSLGPDPLQCNITKGEFIKIFRKPKQDKLIGLVLMDQKLIAGLGNYLRADILYAAKISPFRKLKDLSDEDLGKIWKAVNDIVHKSYDIQVKKGLHHYPFMVYQRKETDKGEEIENQKVDGRTVWWVPSVQK